MTRSVGLFVVLLGIATLGASPLPSPAPSPAGSPLPPGSPSVKASPAAPRPSPSRPVAGPSPSPLPSPSPSPSPSLSPSIASVAKRFAGAWRCEGYTRDDDSTLSYMREESGSIALVGTFDSGKLELDHFSYDAAHGVWQLTTSASRAPFTAVPSTDDRWIFAGMEGDGRLAHAVRMVFTTLGPAAFRREHQVQTRDSWSDDGETVCRRTSTPPPAPAPSPTRRPTPNPTRRPPSPTPSPSPSPSPRPTEADRAYRLVGGTWDCETIEGNSAPHTYSFERDGSLLLHTILSIGTKSFVIDERYRFERSRNRWIATTVGASYASTAPPWLGDKWIFDGTATIDGRRVPVRMIYTDLDERAFRRDFRQFRNGAWDTIASETCKRP